MRIAPPFVPQAVVFDLDGLLVDSEELWGEAEQQVVRDLGKVWDPAVRTLLLGKGPSDAAGALAEYVGVPDALEVERLLYAAAEEHFRAGVPLRPGAACLVKGLRGRVPLGVATNSRRVIAEQSLLSAGVGDAFDVVVCAEDVPAHKPHPAPYATACRSLGVPCERTVGLEDSPVGVASARAAGLWVIGCPSFPDQPTDAAHVVVASLEDIEAEVLLRGAGARA